MAEQLDFFKPVQLGMGLVTQPLKHLTEAEAEALAVIIDRKAGPTRTRAQINAILDTYHLDAASQELVSENIPAVLPF